MATAGDFNQLLTVKLKELCDYLDPECNIATPHVSREVLAILCV